MPRRQRSNYDKWGQHEFYKDEKIGWSGIVEEIFENKQISTHVTHETYTVKITGFLSHILLMKKKKGFPSFWNSTSTAKCEYCIIVWELSENIAYHQRLSNQL